MRKIVALTSLLGVAIAAPVFAQESPWYAGANVGQSRHETKGGTDNKGTQSGFAVGYRWSKVLALELGYTDFGSGKVGIDVAGPVTLSGLSLTDTAFGTAEAKSTHLSALLSSSFADAFSVYGRLGIAETRRSFNGSTNGSTGTITTVNRSERKSEALLGLGLAYTLTNHIGATVEWQKLESTKVQALNAGIRFNF